MNFIAKNNFTNFSGLLMFMTSDSYLFWMSDSKAELFIIVFSVSYLKLSVTS